MKKNGLPLLLAALLLTGPVEAASAQAWGGDRAQMMQQMLKKQNDALLGPLNLTDDQKRRIDDLQERQFAVMKTQIQAIMTKRKDLQALQKKASATVEQALALQKEISDMEQRMAEARLRGWFEIRKVLTPAQLKKMETVEPSRWPWQR